MTLLVPAWMQSQSYSAQQDRLVALAATRPGIVELGDLAVSPRAAGTNMSVDIAPGTVVIKGTDIANQGNYVCRSTAIENRTLAAAPGAGQERRDVVYARVRDGTASGGADNDWILGVEPGVAATAPSPIPTLPPSSIELARVTVFNGTASITGDLISDRRAEALRRTSIDTATAGPITPPTAYTEMFRVSTRVHAYPVEVSAVFVCNIRANANQTNCAVTVRLDVSLDAGATFVSGATPNTGVGPNQLIPGNVTALGYRSGTASGSVVVRVMMLQSGGTGVVDSNRLTVTTAPRNS